VTDFIIDQDRRNSPRLHTLRFLLVWGAFTLQSLADVGLLPTTCVTKTPTVAPAHNASSACAGR